jgi:hypothetical protein
VLLSYDLEEKLRSTKRFSFRFAGYIITTKLEMKFCRDATLLERELKYDLYHSFFIIER